MPLFHFKVRLFRAGDARTRLAIYDFAAVAAGMHFAYNFGLKCCEARAIGTHFVRSVDT